MKKFKLVSIVLFVFASFNLFAGSSFVTVNEVLKQLYGSDNVKLNSDGNLVGQTNPNGSREIRNKDIKDNDGLFNLRITTNKNYIVMNQSQYSGAEKLELNRYYFSGRKAEKRMHCTGHKNVDRFPDAFEFRCILASPFMCGVAGRNLKWKSKIEECSKKADSVECKQLAVKLRADIPEFKGSERSRRENLYIGLLKEYKRDIKAYYVNKIKNTYTATDFVSVLQETRDSNNNEQVFKTYSRLFGLCASINKGSEGTTVGPDKSSPSGTQTQ